MGSKTWLSLSVLSFACAALVGCNNPEKNKSTGTWKDPAPVANKGGGSTPLPNFPSNNGPGGAYPSGSGFSTGAPIQPTGGGIRNPNSNIAPYQPAGASSVSPFGSSGVPSSGLTSTPTYTGSVPAPYSGTSSPAPYSGTSSPAPYPGTSSPAPYPGTSPSGPNLPFTQPRP